VFFLAAFVPGPPSELLVALKDANVFRNKCQKIGDTRKTYQIFGTF
jgi:hypothetical protein